ncbi:Multidrug resistance protein [Desulfonema limicola]|uniref:Multidrug resistance protein n=1 Tax=Desulfonema limicola TaxID=45656 RepID=A0A975B942_9BACT|nr:efflux RND transporter periplasmic adaptor subunit [Desulfonema limicola]QTA81153.1 Multidrug resistance protein [Desulfonema limicola]
MKLIQIILVLLLSASTLYAQGEQPPAKVKTASVSENIGAENAGLIGVLYFDQVSNISTEVPGMAQEVSFREGDKVRQGDVLIKINTDFLDKDIDMQEKRIEQADVRIRKTARNLQRYRKLFKSDAASEIDYDNLNFSHQELIKERETLRTSLAKIVLQKSKCVIKAPFDGIILEKNVGTGDWLIPGRMLCRAGSAKDLFVRVPVAETIVRYVEKNDPVDVVINAYEKKLTGIIEGILPVADEKTKNISLKIRLGDIDDIPFAVAENMSVTVYVPVSEKKKLGIIPRDALIKFQGKDFVYTVKDGKAAIVPVNIVSFMGENIGTDSPHIKPGMQVIVDGNERLKPDQPVEIAGEK